MEKDYAVLHQDGDALSILGKKAVTQLTGVDSIFSDIDRTIHWLKENYNRILIILMPIEESERKYTRQKLSGYENQCIAIDPGQLKVGSRPMFLRTQPLRGTVLAQIRDIIE